MPIEESKIPDFPGLDLSADKNLLVAREAKNVNLHKKGLIEKRPGIERVNQHQYSGAVILINDLGRICDYGKLLVFSGPIFDWDSDMPIFEDDMDTYFDSNYPPIAVASASLVLGDTYQFSGVGSWDPDGSIVSYYWNFGDGSTGSGVSPTHDFSDPHGELTVTLTVTDNSGATATATVVIPANITWVLEAQIAGVLLGVEFEEHAGSMYLAARVGADANLYVRAADGTWSFVDNAGTSCPDLRPALVSHSGDLLLQVSGGVMRLQAGALVNDLVGLNLDGNLINCGGILHTNGRNGGTGQFTYERTGVGAWAFSGPNANHISLYSDFVFDGAIVGSGGRYSNASPPIHSVQADPGAPTALCTPALMGGRLYMGFNAAGVWYKTTAAGAWQNAGADPVYNYRTAASTPGRLWVVGRAAPNYVLHVFDGSAWSEERNFGSESIWCMGTDGTDLFVATYDSTVPEMKIYRRVL